jgi:hypothetical protein
MTDKCMNCGRSASQAVADAKSLGLLEEFQNGIYTCCQVSDWADEQWLAWFEATQQDGRRMDALTSRSLDESDAVPAPVRFRMPQVPWYRNPDELGSSGPHHAQK